MDDSFTTYKTIWALTPELLLVLVAAGIYTAGAFYRQRNLWNSVALLGLVAAGALLSAQISVASGALTSDVTGPLTLDYFAHALRWLALGLGGLMIVGAWHAGNPGLGSEFVGSLLLTVIGVMLVAASRDLVLLFLGLELISIPTYVLLFLGRRDQASGEATVKYFYLSILSSALLLYGFSFVYGAAGTTQLDALAAIAAAPPESGIANLMPIALLLVVAGFGFKLAAAPFHFYAPDVYQGTTSINAGILAVVPKLAGLVALIRFVLALPPDQFQLAWQLLVTLSLVTMTVGNVSALMQTNVRRLLAFSSIAHSGYMLIGVAVALAAAKLPGSESGGIGAALFYVVVYALASFGSFAALAWLGTPEREVNELDELAGLARSQPVAAGALAVFLFSLAGIPPLAGFWGKLALFGSAVRLTLDTHGDWSVGGWFVVLSVVGALNAAVAASYYLRFIGTLYFRDPAERLVPAQGGGGAMAATILSALLVLGIGLLPGFLADETRHGETSALQTAARKRPTIAQTVPEKSPAEATKPVPAEVKSVP